MWTTGAPRFGLTLVLVALVCGCGSSATPLAGGDAGPDDVARIDAAADAADAGVVVTDAGADGPEAAAGRIDATCSLGFAAPAGPVAQPLSVIARLDTRVDDPAVVRVFAEGESVLLVAAQHLVRATRSGITGVVASPATTIDAAQGAASYAAVVRVPVAAAEEARLCLITGDAWPDLASCARVSSDGDGTVRWDGARYWAFGAADAQTRRAATYDETGQLLEEHLVPNGTAPLRRPELFGDLIVDVIDAPHAGGCDSRFGVVAPAALDVPAWSADLVPPDFAPDSPGTALAVSPDRALLLTRSHCWDFVAGAPACGDFAETAPVATLLTLLGLDGTPIAAAERLPDLTVLRLHWDGRRFVGLALDRPACGAGCDPPQSASLELVALDETGAVLARGFGAATLAPGDVGADSDVAVGAGGGFAIVGYRAWSRLRLALVTLPGGPW